MAHRAVYVVTPTVHVAVLNQGARVVIAHRDGRRAQEVGVGGSDLRGSRHPVVLAIIGVGTANASDLTVTQARAGGVGFVGRVWG
jgi:hypothetical protein